MSVWSRIVLVFKAKSRAALDKVEDPREVLGYVDEQQQELLRRVKQGLIEVAISKRQLEQQVKVLDGRIPRLEDQARRALAAGREDLGRLALERKQRALTELEGLEAQVEEVDGEQTRLTMAEQQLAARIEEFRTRRQTLAARYSAAEAQVRVKESLSGVSHDFADLGMALGRAEEKISRMLAHAYAVDALVDSSPLAGPVGDRDMVEVELREVSDREAVEEELAAILEELGPKQATESGESRKG